MVVNLIKKRESYLKTNFEVRDKEESNEKILEGYFVRFNEETELWEGVFEEVDPKAVENSLKDNDIRALFNHDTGIVLGRTGNKTLELKKDAKGLFGRITINENDTEAMNILARIERGDIDACSFGFNVIKEEIEERDDGSVKFVLKDIDLIEVSTVTFPAYPTTSVKARKQDINEYQKEKIEYKRKQLKERLKNA